ncbi:hypothetical protein BDV93DRAFT_75062 [Ceratobasidium sp. AG-I]|nr:hypothetical protein BDV93DRAFT_75062 [Ceratobasidium sp. AG-I]
MRKFGIRRALSTKSVPRSQDPEFVQEDVDEHGRPIPMRPEKPQRQNSLLKRVFRKKSRHSDDLETIHSADGHPVLVRPAPSVLHSDYDGGQHSFAGAGTHMLVEEPVHHEHGLREHSIRDGHSVRDQSVRAYTLHDDRSRGYPEDYASTAGHTHHTRNVHERDFGRDEAFRHPHEHVTVMDESPRHSHITAPYQTTTIPYTTTGTVVDDFHEGRSASGRSARSFRSSSHNKKEVEINLQPGEKQEFEIGPNTQLIVPDDVELEISDEVYVISGGSNFIVEDEMGNVLHRSQPRTYSTAHSTAPVSVAGSVAGRSTRSRRDADIQYID